MNKPYSESCDQNRTPILDVIRPLLERSRLLLEIGSGTGQHAVYFAENLQHLIWQTSDRVEYLPGITMWLEEANLENLRLPVELDVTDSKWPDNEFDAIFTANSVHIMSWSEVESLFSGVGERLSAGGVFIIYGPFNYNHRYTSESNQQFDQWLKSYNPLSCIKNFEDIETLALQAKMRLLDDIQMPANNRILVWKSYKD